MKNNKIHYEYFFIVIFLCIFAPINVDIMCTSPRKIVNRTKSFTEGITRYSYTVPCGKCEECRANLQQEWFIRAWSEIEKYNSSGGKVVFFSPTYRPSCLPTFQFKDSEGIVHTVPCFNKRDKDRFMNSLKHYLHDRYGYDGKDEKLNFMWCSEYGHGDEYYDRKGNKHVGQYQPHHHVLLFIPRKLWRKLNFHHPRLMKDLIERYWPYGFVRWSKQPPVGQGIYVDKEFAGEYCTKYCVKNIEFYDHPELKIFLDEKKPVYTINGVQIKDRRLYLRNYRPALWNSRYFGIDLVKRYTTVESFLDGISLQTSSDLYTAKNHLYKAPRYIERKVLYDFDGYTNSFVINDKGVEVRNAKMQEKRLKESIDKLKLNADSVRIHSLLDDLDIQSIYKDKYTDIVDSQSLAFHISAVMAGRSFEELFFYNCVWSGRFEDSSSSVPIFMAKLNSAPLSEFIAMSQDMYFADLLEKRGNCQTLSDGLCTKK